MKRGKMLEIMLRKQVPPVFARYICMTSNLSYCDSSLVKSKPNLKALVESDFSRAVKRKFKKNFIENLFVNKFQADALEYPELDTIEEIERLKVYCHSAQKILLDETDIDTKNALVKVDSKKTIATLKSHELTGFKIPKLKNGFGFLSCEYSCMQEALAVDPSLLKTVCENEDFGIQLIDLFGSEEQKKQYLGKLISGENISTFAHLESGTFIPFGDNSLSTSAVMSDSENYIISGTKTWVYNGNFADFFILSAKIKSSKEDEVSKPTLFLVNKNSPGVVIHEPIETVGMKNLNICDVTFNEVVVPSSCILGNINEGGEIIKKILCQGKLSNGGHCIGIMRKIIDKCINHCIHNEFFDKDKYSMNHFRNKVGRMAAQIYIAESMTYFLTGRFDSFTDADVFLESLIVKVFSSEALQFVIKEALGILGNELFTDDENLNDLVKDSQFYTACEDTNDHLRLVLAAAGVKYAMNHEYSPSEKLSIFLKSLKYKIFKRETEEVFEKKLMGYLHLMFHRESWMLEDSIDNLHNCTQYVINTHGQNVFHKYLELRHLGDIVVNIYAMVATLSRASRAYCLALQNHEVDRISTQAVVKSLSLQNRRIRLIIRNVDFLNAYSTVSSSIMNSNKYSDLYPVTKILTARNQNNRKLIMKQ